MLTYSLKVLEVRKETEDTFTFCLKQPGLKKVKYLSGQYLTVIVTINNRKFKRPYSFSSAFGIDANIEITIKRVLHGIVSNHLIDTISMGDTMEVLEPLGDFVYSDDFHKDKELYLWGAGSGITPLISIMKSALKNSSSSICLNYSNRSIAETIFYKQLESLKNLYPDRIQINLFYTNQVVNNCSIGRIDENYVKDIVGDSHDLNNSSHFICGPMGLKQVVIESLLKIGILQGQIYSEDFEHTVNELELGDVHSQTVSIVRQGQEFLVEVVRGKSILEAILDFGLDIAYSCQTGSCKLCKGQIKSGRVKTISKEEIGSEILGENTFLLCCSYPLTKDVVFAVD